MLRLEFLVHYYRMGCSLKYSQLATLMARMANLYLLDEWKEEANYNYEKNQGQRQAWNHQQKTNNFMDGQCVKWHPKEVKIRLGKFKLLWKGPYIV
jgi:hypothetical protein